MKQYLPFGILVGNYLLQFYEWQMSSVQLVQLTLTLKLWPGIRPGKRGDN
jgi:hypothetical protein